MTTAAVASPSPAASKKPFVRPAAADSKKKMSVTQTYYLAHRARAKLSREAAQPDHDLRLLVGHANLLDSLMLELADAEREQERWFNQSVRGTGDKQAARHVQWADSIVEEEEHDDDYSDTSDSDSDFYDDDDGDDFAGDDVKMAKAVSARTHMQSMPAVADEAAHDDLEDDYAQLELVRTPSHSSSSPPELLLDHDSESSDDESMPPTPADATLPYDEKEARQRSSRYEAEYYASRRSSASLVTAVSVY